MKNSRSWIRRPTSSPANRPQRISLCQEYVMRSHALRALREPASFVPHSRSAPLCAGRRAVSLGVCMQTAYRFRSVSGVLFDVLRLPRPWWRGLLPRAAPEPRWPVPSSRDHRIEFAMVRQLNNPQDFHTDTDQVNELVARSERNLLAFSNLKDTLTCRPSDAQACASMRDLTGEE